MHPYKYDLNVIELQWRLKPPLTNKCSSEPTKVIQRSGMAKRQKFKHKQVLDRKLEWLEMDKKKANIEYAQNIKLSRFYSMNISIAKP